MYHWRLSKEDGIDSSLSLLLHQLRLPAWVHNMQALRGYAVHDCWLCYGKLILVIFVHGCIDVDVNLNVCVCGGRC